MAGGGGKGGKQTTKVEIPKWLERAAQQNLARADEIATLGYVPRFGPEVAAFSPMQQAAFANTGQAAAAFGLPGGGMTGMEGMPAPTQFAGGIQGYSSTPLYNEMLSALQANAPGQYDFIRGMFIDPTTGAGPRNPFAPLTGGVSAYGGAGGFGGADGSGSNNPFNRDDPYFDGGYWENRANGVGTSSGGGFYDGLRDISGDGTVNFGDTYMGDLLGFDGSFGIGEGNPGMASSIGGGRRGEGEA